MDNQKSYIVEYSMKWHDFNTKIGIFLLMAWNIIYAVLIAIDPLGCFGIKSGEYPSSVKAPDELKDSIKDGKYLLKGVPVMRIIAFVYVAFLVGMAVYFFIARAKLVRRASGSGSFFVKALIIGSVGEVVFNLFARIGAYSPYLTGGLLVKKLKEWFPNAKISINGTAWNVWVVVFSYVFIFAAIIVIIATKNYYDTRSEMMDNK